MLFNEPKLLKSNINLISPCGYFCFSALQRAEIAEIRSNRPALEVRRRFSALQRAEIAEISAGLELPQKSSCVSVLFNEPKLLKCLTQATPNPTSQVSVLFNEPKLLKYRLRHHDRIPSLTSFSALQRAEIAEILIGIVVKLSGLYVSVLFNEPKLLKY